MSTSTSGAFCDLPVTWGSPDRGARRQDEPRGAARGGARGRASRWRSRRDLAANGTPPDQLDVSAEVTFDKLERWTVDPSTMTVRGRVPGIDEETFARDRRGRQGQLPDLARAQGQRRALGRGDAGVAAGARPGPRSPAPRGIRPAVSSPTLDHRGRRAPGGADPLAAACPTISSDSHPMTPTQVLGWRGGPSRPIPCVARPAEGFPRHPFMRFRVTP